MVYTVDCMDRDMVFADFQIVDVFNVNYGRRCFCLADIDLPHAFVKIYRLFQTCGSVGVIKSLHFFVQTLVVFYFFHPVHM